MKTFQRILIILGAATLVAVVLWAAVSVISIAILPTDTMDYPTPKDIDVSIAVPGFIGYIKPLILITLVVIVEQFIEKRFAKKKTEALSATPI